MAGQCAKKALNALVVGAMFAQGPIWSEESGGAFVQQKRVIGGVRQSWGTLERITD